MENQTSQPRVPVQADEDNISLLDLLIVLARHKKMIIGVTFAASLIAVGYALNLPNIYTATVRILPPQQNQSAASALLGQLGGLAGMAGAAGIKKPNDVYIAMLKSDKIRGEIVKRFDLQKVYEEETLTGAAEALAGGTSITLGKDGILAVAVSDLDPKRAADLANAFFDELNKLLQTYSLTDASQKRTFFDQQLRQAKDRLTDAELLLDKTPNTSLDYLDAVRNLKYQEAVWEILAKQFEMAKLDEAKDFPLIQVLDKAVPPERKSKPRRSLVVILATLAAFFLAMIWAFVKEALSRSSADPEQAGRLSELRELLRWKRS